MVLVSHLKQQKEGIKFVSFFKEEVIICLSPATRLLAALAGKISQSLLSTFIKTIAVIRTGRK